MVVSWFNISISFILLIVQPIIFSGLAEGAIDLENLELSDAGSYLGPSQSLEEEDLSDQYDYDLTLEAYDRAISNSPQSAYPYYLKGVLLLRMGENLDPPTSDEISLDGRSPGTPEYYFGEALISLEQAIVLDPEMSEAWREKGYALYLLKMYNESLAALNESIRLNLLEMDNNWRFIAFGETFRLELYDPKSWNHKIKVLLAMGRKEEALAAAEEALTINPNEDSHWTNKGIALRRLSRYNDSLEALEEAISLNPNSSEAWYEKGLTLKNGFERYYGAIDAFDRALELDPDMHEAWFDKAMAFSALRAHQTAVNSIERAIELDPTNYRYWGNKGTFLARLNRYKEAIEPLKKATELNQTDATAWYLLGYVRYNARYNYSDDEAFEEALGYFERAIELDPNHSLAWYYKGEALRHLRRYGEAIEALEKSTDLDPNDGRRWCSLGDALIGKAGNKGGLDSATVLYYKKRAIELGYDCELDI